MLLGYRRYKALANLYIGLVHYPIMNKHKDVITTAITNYDIHDIARASITYDVSKYFVIHNIPAQRELAATIMEHWKSGFGSTYNPDRKDAFTGVKETMESFDYILEPIYGHGEYNHLSVRSAVSIILDRLRGEAWWNK